MNLRLLRYFLAVVDAGTISGAAQQLQVGQPTLSRQIRQLEQELGMDLFVRAHGTLALNAAGREFVHLAADLVERSEKVRRLASQMATGRLSTVTIASTSTALVDVIAPFLATFTPADPTPYVDEVQVPVDPGKMLLTADLLALPQRPHPEHASLPLWNFPIVAYVRPGDEWADRREVSIPELMTRPLVVTSRALSARRLLDAEIERTGAPPPSMVETFHARVAQALAAAGRGVAVLSDDPRFGLIPLQVIGSDGPLVVGYHMAWRADHHAQQALRSLAERLRAFCARMYAPAEAGSGVSPAADATIAERDIDRS